jgi:hypothetical protein
MNMQREAAGGPPLLARTVAALQGSGRLVRTDWDLETFDVLPADDGAEPTLGVVMTSLQAVVFYHVWPDPVPAQQRAAMAEYTTRANADLYTSAFEFDLDGGTLSLRAGVQFAAGPREAGDLELLTREAFTRLLTLALDEVETTAAAHAGGIAAVLGGRAVLDALAEVG